MNSETVGPVIRAGGEPFYFSGNEIGCLLVHGFTDSAMEMRPFGEYLHSKGYTAHGIRVTGHATHIDDLRRSRWSDLLASVEDGYALLKSDPNVKKIFIIGHSMGGGLTLLASSYLKMDGVVALAPAYRLSAPNKLAEYQAAFGVFWSSLKRKWRSRNLPERLPGWYWYEPELSRGYIKYDEKPLISNLQLIRIGNRAAEVLPRITAPILLMGSRKDTIIDADSLNTVYAQLSSTDKEIFWLEKSSHMLPIDGERQIVFEQTYKFIQRVAGQH